MAYRRLVDDLTTTAYLHVVEILGEGGRALRAHRHVVRQPHLLNLRDSHLHGLSRREKKNVSGKKDFSFRDHCSLSRNRCLELDTDIYPAENPYLPTVPRVQHPKSLAAEAPDVLRTVVEPLFLAHFQSNAQGR